MENTQKYGLSVTGIVRVFAKTKQVTNAKKVKYKITDVWFNVSEKDDDGNWVNKSINLLFPKDSDIPENNTIIAIKDSFYVLSGTGDYRKPAIMVMAWEEAEIV